MGVLRAIWDHRASLADTLLVIHMPDPAQVKALRSLPSTFSGKVTEWLHAQVQLLLSPLVSLQHTDQFPNLPEGCTSTELGMHLAQSYVHSGISPLSSILSAHVASSLNELSFHDLSPRRQLPCWGAP